MKKTILFILSGLLLYSCSNEQLSDSTLDGNNEFTFSIADNSTESAAEFDADSKGIYKGFLSNTDATLRGSYVLNAANDGGYGLFIDIIGLDPIQLPVTSVSNDGKELVFEGLEFRFKFDLSLHQEPQITLAQAQNQELTATIKKQSSRMPMMLRTGTFDSVENPDLTGSWNLVLLVGFVPGDIPPPPGDTAVAEVVIMHNGNVYNDNSMEMLDTGALCVSSVFDVPYMTGFDGDDIRLVSNNQTSDFGGGTTNWEVVFYFGAGDFNYFDDTCTPTSSGTFTFTPSGGGAGVNGTILIDGFPGT